MKSLITLVCLAASSTPITPLDEGDVWGDVVISGAAEGGSNSSAPSSILGGDEGGVERGAAVPVDAGEVGSGADAEWAAESAEAAESCVGVAGEGLLHCYLEGCVAECSNEIAPALLLLLLVGMSAHTFGSLLSGLGFPAITTFLFFGVVAGPYGCDVLSSDESRRLLWLNDVALGFIGLSAGGKLHLNEVRENLSAAVSVLTGLVSVTWVASVLSTLALGDLFLPFLVDLPLSHRISAALLIACLAVARSPSSAIAIIEELHAKGPFTTTVLTVTVLMDVVVVLLFALTQLVVNALTAAGEAEGGEGGGGAAAGAMLLLAFLKQTLLSVVAGALLGFAYPLVVYARLPDGWCRTPAPVAPLALLVGALVAFAQRAAFLLTGFALFFGEEYDEVTRGAARLNPLVVCMVAALSASLFSRLDGEEYE